MTEFDFSEKFRTRATVVELILASLIYYVNVSRIGFLSLSPFRDVAKYILHFFHFMAAVLEKTLTMAKRESIA